MKKHAIISVAILAAFIFAAPTHAQSSPVFTGETSDVWLVNPETGQIAGYDAGIWVSSIDTLDLSSIPLGQTDVVLVNALASSSVQMTPGQPSISIAGLGSAGLTIGAAGDGGREDVVLSPEIGSFTGTTPIQISVSSTVLSSQEHVLEYSLTNEQSGLVVQQQTIPLPAGAGANGDNGYFNTRVFLVETGNYNLDVQLFRGVALKATATGSYSLQVPSGEERRDSDGDGIPDLVETDIGLNPLEDDWTVDLDGDGWSEFDEWLRLFCLDPVTRLPDPNDPSCTDASGRPVDSDDDNWSDFDEILRGTNPNDPEPDLSVVLAASSPAALKFGAQPIVSKAAPTEIQDVAFCTDGSTFALRVEFYAEADDALPGDIIFGIGADAQVYTGGISKQRIRANWNESGGVSRGAVPEVQEFISDGIIPPDRWQIGIIDDFTIAQPQTSNWVVTASIPVGSEPFQPGDSIFQIGIRALVSGDVYSGAIPISGNLGDCAVLGPPPPPPPPPPVDESEFGELESQLRLRFKDFPAATRLYEVEYLIANGALAPPAPANAVIDQQNVATENALYSGVVVQSLLAASDNIAGVNVVVTSSEPVTEDVILNVWQGALRSGELLVSQTLEDVRLEAGERITLPFRFEARATQPGEPIYIELRKDAIQAAAAASDNIINGEIIEIDGAPVSGVGELVFESLTDNSFTNGVGGRRTDMRWWTVGATNIDGKSSYDATNLVSDAEIAAVGLVPGDLAERRRLAQLESRLDENRLPLMRLPAGDSQVVAVVDRYVGAPGPNWTPPDNYSRVYKHWFAKRNDVTPIDMLDTQGAGRWTTPGEWRNEFVSYLVPRLVLAENPTIDEDTTLTVSILEASLGVEASLDGTSGAPLFADIFQPAQPVYIRDPGQPTFVKPIPDPKTYISEWEQNLAGLTDAGFSLDSAAATLPSAFTSSPELSGVRDFLLTRFRAGVPGTRSDAYLSQSVRRSFDDRCFVRTETLPDLQANADAWSVFFDRCPVYFDDAGLSLRLEEDRDRTYLVRLATLPGAIDEIANDPTLFNRVNDSDLDGLLNTAEIARSVTTLTLPWLNDSDGDMIADADDQCPVDPLNACSANPVLPIVTLGDDLQVSEPVTGNGFAIISVQLNRLYDRTITVCYEALATATDTAIGDVDFTVVNDCIEIEPGQLGGLISVGVPSDGDADSGETFTVRITSVDGAVVGDDGTVVVTLNDPGTNLNEDPVFTSADSSTVTSGQTSTGYTARAIDVDNDPVTFSIDGGMDALLLTVDSGSGALSFVAAPDFFVPADADANNDYEIRLAVADGRGGADTLDLIVSVIDGGAGGLKLQFAYPTPSANLGGTSSETSVVISATDRDSNPVSTTDIETLTINGTAAEPLGGGLWRSSIPLQDRSLQVDVLARSVDGRSGSVSTRFANEPVVLGFSDITVIEGGQKLLVVDEVDRFVIAVDQRTGRRERILSIPVEAVRDFAWDSHSNVAWLLGDEGLFRSTLAADGQSSAMQRTDSLPLEDARSLAVDSAGHRLWVLGSKSTLEIDLLSGAQRQMPLPSGIGDPRFIEFNASAQELLVLDVGQSTLVGLDTSGNESRRIAIRDVDLSAVESVAFDRSQNRLLLAEHRGDVFALNLIGGGMDRLGNVGDLLGLPETKLSGIGVYQDRVFVADSMSDSVLEFDDDLRRAQVLSHNRVGHDVDRVSLARIEGFVYSSENRELLLKSSAFDRFIAIDVDGGNRSSADLDQQQLFTKLEVDIDNQRGVVDEAGCTVCALDTVSQTLYTFDDESQLISVDLATRKRSVVSGHSNNGGISFLQPTQLTIDIENQRAFVYDEAAAGVIVVQLATGERALTSK